MLAYGEKNAENVNRLSRVHQRYRQADDRRICDSIIANVNASSRPQKTGKDESQNLDKLCRKPNSVLLLGAV